LQEALNNVKKHAHATQVKVTALFTQRQIKLTVQDNGQGFEVPETLTDFASNGSFGMMGLQERARLFGGNVIVQSRPNQGTTILLVVPRQSAPSQFEVPQASASREAELSKETLVLE
jgi:two-component system sensor histidine kinase DegS